VVRRVNEGGDMKKILVISIGAGDPEHITVQAINALNATDVFFVLDKGEAAHDLLRLREEICARYIAGRSYRTVRAEDPRRDRKAGDYGGAVERWHHDRAALFEALIRDELKDGECGAFLVWGDPSLYDSTLRILAEVTERGAVRFDYEVIPGVSSAHVLAAAHRIPLNRIGQPVHFTTGRRVVDEIAADPGDCVVFLDDGSALAALADRDLDIFWGAYLGTPRQILISGHLNEVAATILETRRSARQEAGWIMDLYLLRRCRAG
jgi:precorrin-6A synthase